MTSGFLKPRAVGQRIENFKMADKSSDFTEAERRRMEAINKQFATRQKQLKQVKRRNFAIFACLLTSVAGICILFITKETMFYATHFCLHFNTAKKTTYFKVTESLG